MTKAVPTTCPVCEFDRAYILDGKLWCGCGLEAPARSFSSSPEHISLYKFEYENLKGTYDALESFYEVLRPLYRDDEIPLDTLKRVVAERDKAEATLQEFYDVIAVHTSNSKTPLDALRQLVEKQDQSARDSAALLDTIAKLRDDAEEYTKIILQHEQMIDALNKSVSGFENGYKKELQSRRELEDGIEEALKNFQRDDESFLEAVVRLAEEYGERGEELSAAWDEMPTELINGKTMGECIAILVSGFNRKEVEIARLNAELEKIRTLANATRLQSTVNAVKELKEWCRYIERAGNQTSRDLSVDRDSAIRQRDKLAVERDELKAELDRLNARFTEVQAESKQPPLPREIARVHSNLCRALELLPKGEHQKAAILICSSLEELGELIFNWQERTEVKQ